MRNNEPLEATLAELRAAGYSPTVRRGKHWKVICDGLPGITVSVSSSDPTAVHMARRLVRKIVARALTPTR